MRNIKCKDIVSKINDDFGNKYKPFSKFKDSGEIWDECMKAVNDPKLMNHIIFCNDSFTVIFPLQHKCLIKWRVPLTLPLIKVAISQL